MMFKLMAPFYDWFIKASRIDHSGKVPVWLAPVEDMELLDLGGGTGLNAEALSKAGAKVTIVDYSQAMLNRAAAKKMPVRLIRSAAEVLPLPDCSFDIVLISDAWHHFRDQAGVISEVRRVLRPGGRLYIIDFDPGQKAIKFIAFFEKLLAEPATFTAPDELVELLRLAGIIGGYDDLRIGQYIYSGVKQKP
jgi:demethylmenaquinone methyltransferase/2-methoxy-6-polyprenyl-1,4-benzoquinol methylase